MHNATNANRPAMGSFGYLAAACIGTKHPSHRIEARYRPDMDSIDRLAQAAAAEVHPGDTVGLGTGRAASRAILAIGARAKREGFEIAGVPTSEASATLAREVGIRVIALDEASRIDVLLDGVDELDPGLAMIKGQGGAMTREMIVAHASARCVYLMQRSKLVARLGERVPVPVEVLRSASSLVRATLERKGVSGEWRRDEGGALVITDNGNPILDCPLTDALSPGDTRQRLMETVGVIGHGLFLDQADRVIIEDESGGLEVRDRTA